MDVGLVAASLGMAAISPGSSLKEEVKDVRMSSGIKGID